MILNNGEEVTWHGNIAELPITDVIIKYLENMDSRKTTKVINIMNREKVIYNTNNWIAQAEYKEFGDDPNDPNMP